MNGMAKGTRHGHRRISYFLAEDGDGWRSLTLRAGNKVIVSGSLKFQVGGLFVGAYEIALVTGQQEPDGLTVS